MITPFNKHLSANPILAVLTLALIYTISEELALLLALPPGYASMIFPPAGIAVAALTIGGTRLLPAWRLALNLSARQCHASTLLGCVDRLQQETGVDLHWLEREITETAAMQDPEQTQHLLRQL